LLWVVLERKQSEQVDPYSDRVNRHTIRVLTRETGEQYELVMGDRDEPSLIRQAEWEHGLGVVPFVPAYASRCGPMQGESYVDVISRGDWRLLQLESDQSFASYLHGSPRLVLYTSAPLDDVHGGGDSILKLNPSNAEDAKYLQVDTGGMLTREQVIERTSRQILNSAGIDPNAVLSGKTTVARSGVSMAWSFTTAEEPTLSRYSQSMTRADRAILEVVTRYLLPSIPIGAGPSIRVCDWSVQRTPKWDLMDVDRTVDVVQAARELVPSRTLQEHLALDLAQRARPNADSTDIQTYADEIAQASDADLMPGLALGVEFDQDEQEIAVQSADQ
jgi:hypothetical protein